MAEISENVVFLDSTALISMSKNISKGNVSFNALKGLTGPQNPTTVVTTTVLRELAPGRNFNSEIVLDILGNYASGQDNLYVLRTPQVPKTLGGEKGAGELSIIHTLSGLPIKVPGADNLIFGRQIPSTLGFNNVIIVSDNIGDFPDLLNPQVMSLEQYIGFLDQNGHLPDHLRSELINGDFDPTECFLSGTPVRMWPEGLPLDFDSGHASTPASEVPLTSSFGLEVFGGLGSFESDVLSGSLSKPIEDVCVGDVVVSYDKEGRLRPGRVTRLYRNRVRHVLDVFGLKVTPGHVTLCGDGVFEGRHVPVLDILRSDGALVRADGSMVRAGTGCDLGSAGDRMVMAVVGERQTNGQIRIAEAGEIRAGTRVLLETGQDVSVLDLIEANGGVLGDDGYVQTSSDGAKLPFHWTFTPGLPKPEDYVLQRSAVTLPEIYEADEWEAVAPRMAAPDYNSNQRTESTGHHKHLI